MAFSKRYERVMVEGGVVTAVLAIVTAFTGPISAGGLLGLAASNLIILSVWKAKPAYHRIQEWAHRHSHHTEAKPVPVCHA